MKEFEIVTYCQPSEGDKLVDVMSQAGAGTIGNYTHCAFITKGEGIWFSEPDSHPTIGKVGQLSREAQIKIEMRCNEENLTKVIAAIKSIHNYETPEIDVYPLLNI